MTDETQRHYAAKALAASNLRAAEDAARAADRPPLRASSREPLRRGAPVPRDTVVVTPDPWAEHSPTSEGYSPARIGSPIRAPGHEPELPELSAPQSLTMTPTHAPTEAMVEDDDEQPPVDDDEVAMDLTDPAPLSFPPWM
eukprot:8028259-Heterocapsa_arctica.AAC.1